jgi:ketosteroid isomerase-like protein
VSQADVELVRQLLAPFEAGDMIPLMSRLPDMGLAPFFTDDFQCVFAREDVGRAAYEGLEGLQLAWLDWLEPWESYHAGVEELIDVGDGRVVVLTRDHAQPKGAHGEADFLGAPVWTVREGKVARIEFYFNRAQGLAAAGLAE